MAARNTKVERFVSEGVRLEDGLVLRDIVAQEQAEVETTVHLKLGFWNAFSRLSEDDADVISLLMQGFKYKDMAVNNARYRIRIAKKRFEVELGKEGIDVCY